MDKRKVWTARITIESQKRARPIDVCIDKKKEKEDEDDTPSLNERV
jgi:hypothetical protein